MRIWVGIILGYYKGRGGLGEEIWGNAQPHDLPRNLHLDFSLSTCVLKWSVWFIPPKSKKVSNKVWMGPIPRKIPWTYYHIPS